MKIEVPEFKRCCFCVPLRYGLLVWSYLILIPITIGLLLDGMNLKYVFTVRETEGGNNSYWVRDTEFTLSFLVRLGIFVFTILLIVAAHRKSLKLLKVYYKSGLTLALLNVLFTIIDTFNDVIWTWNRSAFYETWFWEFVMFFFLIGLVFFGMQLYIIVLVRSEILKLENNDKYEFSNMAAESERAYNYFYQPETNINFKE